MAIVDVKVYVVCKLDGGEILNYVFVCTGFTKYVYLSTHSELMMLIVIAL